ncbi:tachykinin-4 [Orcinus orca]|uniref:tachykinin-4 n=1 Tax=Orcinus orca TaxID=9733 RepID=UPI00062B62D7|nr:tachykinin-4 [Orcinus orca]
MLLCVTPPLLTGLSACTVAGDKELPLDAEAGSWGTVTLEEDVVPSIQLQLWEVKRSKASQFFGLMGKQVGGIPPIQPERRAYQRGPVVQGHLGRGGPSTEEDEKPLSPYLDVTANQPASVSPGLIASMSLPPGPH